jgi:hypothetical protein
VNLARIAQIEKKADNDGLVSFPREELNLLLFPFIENPEVCHIQIGNEAAAVIGDRDGDNDLVALDAERLLGC